MPFNVQTRPSVFIGSSSEGLAVAEAFRDALMQDADVSPWHEGIFRLGEGYLESLVTASKGVDFAVLVLTADDLTTSRRKRQQSPRDNVLFECGLFVGTLGRHRTFIAIDRRTDLRLPSDLAGIKLAEFGQRELEESVSTQIAPAVTEIRDAIARHGKLRPLPAPFWQPFVYGRPSVVLGRFGQFDTFEASGVLGVGDAICLTLISSFTGANYHLELPVAYSDKVSGDDLASDLILIGGPDNNSVTKDVIGRVPTTLMFANPERFEVSFASVEANRLYSPEFASGKVIVDYGIILRTSNPFDRRHKVLVLFGCFGFGTWASGRCVCSEEFLAHPLVAAGSNVECVVRAEVVRGVPQQPIICELRELGASLT
jgi:hypothetical protein